MTATTQGRWPAPTARGPLGAVVPVPGSKSASNRALVLAALADGPSVLHGVLDARDSRLMIDGLRGLGAGIEVGPTDEVGNIEVTVVPAPLRGPVTIDCGLAGTVMRFLPPVAALATGRVVLDGDARARERPMAAIVDALHQLGVVVDAAPGGLLPIAITGTGSVAGGVVRIDASASSQFVSGLLLAGPRFDDGVTVVHAGGPLPSVPHIDMTVAMLAEHGVSVERTDATTWRVANAAIAALDRSIEPDLSNAAPFLAAAVVAGGSVTIPGWPRDSTQPGVAVADLLAAMGGTVTRGDSSLTVVGDGTIRSIDVDLGAIGELAPTIAALAALADGPSRLRGIAHLRGHETDRLRALAAELGGLGTRVDEMDDGLAITPGPLRAGIFHTYGDHRMATAGAIIGLRVPGVVLDDVGVTAKTLPGFTATWDRMLGTATGAS